MALSDWDRKYLNSGQQRAVLAYTDAWEKANRAGDTAAMGRAHAGTEAIRRQAGYSGGAEGAIYAPSVNSTSTAANARRPERVLDASSSAPAAFSTTAGSGARGYDNGLLTREQVKELQSALGVAQDGYFGAKTSAAAQQRWGVSSADEALRSYQSSQQRTSYGYDGNAWTWNGTEYFSQKALLEALNKANLGEGEKNALATAMRNAGGGVAYENGRFVGTQRQQKAESVKPQQSTGYVNPLAPGRNGSPSARGNENAQMLSSPFTWIGRARLTLKTALQVLTAQDILIVSSGRTARMLFTQRITRISISFFPKGLQFPRRWLTMSSLETV